MSRSPAFGPGFFLRPFNGLEEGDLDRDFFLVEEAPLGFFGQPLWFFTVADLEVVSELGMDNFFFSCPTSEFNFFVLAATSEAMMLWSSSMSTLVSALRRSAVLMVASSRESSECSFLRLNTRDRVV